MGSRPNHGSTSSAARTETSTVQFSRRLRSAVAASAQPLVRGLGEVGGRRGFGEAVQFLLEHLGECGGWGASGRCSLLAEGRGMLAKGGPETTGKSAANL